MLLVVASALGAAFGYRFETVAMAFSWPVHVGETSVVTVSLGFCDCALVLCGPTKASAV